MTENPNFTLDRVMQCAVSVVSMELLFAFGFVIGTITA